MVRRTRELEGEINEHMRHADARREQGDFVSAIRQRQEALRLIGGIENSHINLIFTAKVQLGLGVDYLSARELLQALQHLVHANRVLTELEVPELSELWYYTTHADVCADLANALVQVSRVPSDPTEILNLLDKALTWLDESDDYARDGLQTLTDRIIANEGFRLELFALQLRAQRDRLRFNEAMLYKGSKDLGNKVYARNNLIRLVRFSRRYRLRAFLRALPLMRVEPRGSYGRLFASLLGDRMYYALTRRK